MHRMRGTKTASESRLAHCEKELMNGPTSSIKSSAGFAVIERSREPMLALRQEA
jgi:hypothetical protein